MQKSVQAVRGRQNDQSVFMMVLQVLAELVTVVPVQGLATSLHLYFMDMDGSANAAK